MLLKFLKLVKNKFTFVVIMKEPKAPDSGALGEPNADNRRSCTKKPMHSSAGWPKQWRGGGRKIGGRENSGEGKGEGGELVSLRGCRDRERVSRVARF